MSLWTEAKGTILVSKDKHFSPEKAWYKAFNNVEPEKSLTIKQQDKGDYWEYSFVGNVCLSYSESFDYLNLWIRMVRATNSKLNIKVIAWN